MKKMIVNSKDLEYLWIFDVLLDMMKMRNILVLFGIFLIVSVCLQAQASESQAELTEPDKLFVRTTIYPTANLSRYDYNNDLDLYEIRAYVELRIQCRLDFAIRNYDEITVFDKTRENLFSQ